MTLLLSPAEWYGGYRTRLRKYVYGGLRNYAKRYWGGSYMMFAEDAFAAGIVELMSYSETMSFKIAANICSASASRYCGKEIYWYRCKFDPVIRDRVKNESQDQWFFCGKNTRQEDYVDAVRVASIIEGRFGYGAVERMIDGDDLVSCSKMAAFVKRELGKRIVSGAKQLVTHA